MGFFGELKQDLSQVAGDELKRERADAEAERILAGAQLAGLDEAESFRRSVSTDNNSIDDDDDVAALLKDLVAGLSADDMPLAEEKSSAEETYPNHAPQTEADTAQAETEPADDEPVVSEEPSESEPKAEVTTAEESVINGMAEETVIESDSLFEDDDTNPAGFLHKVFSIASGSDSEETSVITEGMVIKGNVESAGNLELKGRVNGDITVGGRLNVTGSVTGNSTAKEIYAGNAKIIGNINSESSVSIGAGTIVVGNISAFGAAIAGAVKGDIDVHGPVVLDSTAIVKGNIRSKSVQINTGAVLEGVCSQAYAEVSPTTFFDDYKPEKGE